MAGLMDIGKSGLQSYREALSVTGQNIANINTDGYKRREASLEEVIGTSGGLTSVSSQAGLGVRVAEVRRAFDEFLLNKARNATSYAASAESYLETVSQLENILIPGESNIGSSIGRFMETLQEVAANPSDIAPRIVAIESGKTLTNTFHQTSTLLKEVQNGVDTQSSQALREVNLLTASLANINRNISASGGKAQNALLDNRDAVIDKISEYLEVNVTLESTGAATLNLGAMANGPVLVKNEKSSNITSLVANGNLEFFVANGAEQIRTSQVTNGRISGLADAFKSTTDVIAKLDNLAYKLIQDINQIHQQGIDLEGNQGVDMFHGVAFDAVPNISNRGDGLAVVDVTNVQEVNGESIRLNYDGEANLWRAYGAQDQLLASGMNKIVLPGMSITFSGDALTGDEFTLEPAKGTAGIIQFALSRPEQIAASSSFLVSTDINNKSNAQITVGKSEAEAQTQDLPDIQTVITNSHTTTSASQFISDGAVAIIPANTDRVDLISLVQQSSASFGIPSDALPQINVLSLEVDDGVNQPKTYNFDLSAYADSVNLNAGNTDKEPFTWYDAEQIANLMNVGALTATTATDLDSNNNPIQFTLNDLGGYASGKEGSLSLSLKEMSFTDGAVSFGNSPTQAAVVKGRVDQASDIQIFTREGRHIAGKSYDGVSALISTENGFNANAEYRSEYLNLSGDQGYLGLSVDYNNNVAANLITVDDTDDGYAVSFDRILGIDTNESSPFGKRASAGQFDYQLSIGDFNVTLNEGNVDGDDRNSIAKAALDAIREQAPVPSMTGISAMTAAISFALTAQERATLDANNALSVSREGIDYVITEVSSGVYDISGGRAGTLTLSFNDSTDTVSSTYLNLPREDEKLSLSFEDQVYTIHFKDGEAMVSGGEEGRLIAGLTSDHKIQIIANKGSLNKDKIIILEDSDVAGNTAIAKRFGLITSTSRAQTVFSNLDVSKAKTVTRDQAGDRTPDTALYPDQKTLFSMITVQNGDPTTPEIQKLSGLEVSDLAALEDNRFIVEVDNKTLTLRLSNAPTTLAELATLLNAGTAAISLDATFGVNANGDAIELTFNSNGDVANGTSYRVEDLPEIQTVSGFDPDDLLALENNGLEFSDGTRTMRVDFTTPPASLTELVAILNAESITQGFTAEFSAGANALTLTWPHTENLGLITANLIETYDVPHFDISQTGNTLSVVRGALHSGDPIAITKSAKSNAEQRITLSDLPDEDLIVFITGSDDGQGGRARTLSAVYDQHPATTIMPRDISVRVTDAANGTLEFIDTETGTSLATRTLDGDGQTSALGYDIKILGTIAGDDLYYIENNSDGIHDNRNLLDLIALQNSTAGKGGFQTIFNGLIAQVGAEIEAGEINAEASNALKDASLEAEAMYSGVNLDTEASKLIELQQAYQASARILQTAREMFNTLIDTI